MSRRTVAVTVWSDIACPWATLALHTLRGAAQARRVDVEVTHRGFPLELFNSQPTPRAVTDAEIVAIAGLREELGWRPWHGVESAYPVTTLPAMEAVRAVAAADGPAAGDRLDAALRDALFVDSRCISLYSVILEVASECGAVDVDRLADALRSGTFRRSLFDDWHEADRSAEVQGSPTIVTGSTVLVNPGVTMTWLGAPEHELPRVSVYDDGWVSQILG